MSPYTDIHSHILPKIDDGAENLDMSLEMLRTAFDNGIRRIILTPHNKPMRHNAGPEKMKELTQALLTEMKKSNLEIELYNGNEIYYHSDILTLLEQKKALTLADSDYVLVEFGPMDDFAYIRRGIHQLLSGGYRPILAHVERYSALRATSGCIQELAAMGCCIQVNAGSIMGQYGLGTKLFTRKLLSKELVHFVATDAHDNGKRSPAMLSCMKFIERKYGKGQAERIFVKNPDCILSNEYI